MKKTEKKMLWKIQMLMKSQSTKSLKPFFHQLALKSVSKEKGQESTIHNSMENANLSNKNTRMIVQ
jgi:hypothetical protein